jgi:hypothetical protein
MSPDARFKISSPPEDFHVAIGGRKDTQTNSNADREVDARYFVRAMIRNFEVFSSANDAVMPIPEEERTFCEALHAAEMAGCDSGFRRTDAIISLSMLYQQSALMPNICKKYVEDCLRDAARYRLLCVFVDECKVGTFPPNVRTPLLHLFNPTGHVLRVESHFESTDRLSRYVHIQSLSPADQRFLGGTLVSEPYQIMDPIHRKRVVAKTIETAYVYDCMHFLLGSVNRAGANMSRTAL